MSEALGKSVLAIGFFRNSLLHPMACACCPGCMPSKAQVLGTMMFLRLQGDATFTGHGQDILGISQITGRIIRGEGDSLRVTLEKKYLEPHCASTRPIQYTFTSYEGWKEFQQLYHLRYLGLCGQYTLVDGDSDIASLVLFDHLPDLFYFANKAAQILGLSEEAVKVEEANSFSLLDKLREILGLKETTEPLAESPTEIALECPPEHPQGYFDGQAAPQPKDVAR
ncbi:MAG: hypothetical protein UT86_C0003G0090 [Candidatus Magasanikbacteria bacterium GW2011_GWC2_40_17]|uniref:Uncharacterized protein n=1 Tax=Candidatus Magasanikbacteria bacterium GW2011_GWA2_42_32 TaxID=1619039 RepID=A0A0G1D4N3_9BACT|nr:MAG: hypothetical protein UT86_C0003G0090 [Candidatus Magasanikbacteria bacterium GW2011_GWC2_40_17]KKS56993.1 MAG: hypothetical protein UV20_C0004G0089 [Candidatus Magasanikbacteria bacterium GW2011_GWA2_42_32]OGH85720.1 MAG: hypothetical protein A2294_03785 [Candidatus Magasanikbacteria bacterium RIFOXYB2_FULL_38_10]